MPASSTPRYTKTTLPQKPCLTCGRPFAYRKKWRSCWDEVKYCSERCRRQRGGSEAANIVASPTR